MEIILIKKKNTQLCVTLVFPETVLNEINNDDDKMLPIIVQRN